MSKFTEAEKLLIITALLSENPDSVIIDEGTDSEGRFRLSSHPAEAITCDFCSKKNDHAATYITERFSIPVAFLDGMVVETESTPEWSACTECKVLIEAKDVEGLIDRSLEAAWSKAPSFIKSEPENKQRARADIGKVQYAFWEHRVK